MIHLILQLLNRLSRLRHINDNGKAEGAKLKHPEDIW